MRAAPSWVAQIRATVAATVWQRVLGPSTINWGSVSGIFLPLILFCGFIGFVGMGFVLLLGGQSKKSQEYLRQKNAEDALLREAELKRAREDLGRTED
ncbi:hypothetical protein LK09_06095 [Microbacterium mangrovi]|uniref:Uncharacterized protein n=1 Tax=Microbacterium mangrovi TaxID=1348253 RepID=A0A0B2A4V4_9MICO|nr:hypothetical protein [Microbacterium mangrovi]KHK98544.1 hypothetical protein LK09_06095 [Microbacterium mangrovi]